MSYQARRIRAVYTLLALLVVTLPMCGWYARSVVVRPAAQSQSLLLRADSPVCRSAGLYTNMKVDANAVRH